MNYIFDLDKFALHYIKCIPHSHPNIKPTHYKIHTFLKKKIVLDQKKTHSLKLLEKKTNCNNVIILFFSSMIKKLLA